MNSKFYSPSQNAFYAGEMRADYERSGTWPDDATEISNEAYADIQVAISAGHVIVPDVSGHPGAVAQFAYDQQAAVVMSQFRGVREVALNRLIGIGFEAMLDKKTATVQAVVAARAALLNVTVITSTDVATLKAAVQVEYDRIIAAAPELIRGAFPKLNFN